MPHTKIDDDHWELIVERIFEKYCGCVPFLGAAVNLQCPGYQGLPLGTEVNRTLVERLVRRAVPQLTDLAQVTADAALDNYKDLARVALEDLARVALYFRTKRDEPSLIKHLRKVLPDEQRDPSKLLNVLARQRFGLIVTTNYDRLMERALADIQKPYKRVIQPRKGFSDDEKKALQYELADFDGTVIYKMHGSFLDDGPQGQKRAQDVIITEEQYIEFLTVVGHPEKGVPPLIAEKIKNSTLLFLGYGLADWDFRALFKGLVESLGESDRRKSFAIQKDPSPFWAEFWEKKDVIIYNVDLYEFADELDQRCLAYEQNNGLGANDD